MNEVITHLDQVTAEWLTEVLHQSGALNQGTVATFEMDTDDRELSSNARLRLKYSEDAAGQLPRKLFLKLVNADMEDEFFGSSEVNYYIRDYVDVPGVPIPRCYHAIYSESLRRYHILMDDLSETHTAAYNKRPTLEHGLALAEGLAAMHAHYWERERLERAGEPIPSPEAIKRFVEIARPGAGHIIAACADQLKPHWPDMIYALYEKHPPLMIDRTRNGNGFTLIHGDTNLTNILVPIDGDRPIYIVDRQPFDWSLTTWLGVYDLSYTMVMRWDAEIRRQLEQPILRHYHHHLMQRGVQDYSWEQLFEDYRLSAVMSVYVATEWCRGGLNRDTQRFWMPLLQRSMRALDDLECNQLWS